MEYIIIALVTLLVVFAFSLIMGMEYDRQSAWEELVVATTGLLSVAGVAATVVSILTGTCLFP